MSLADCGIVFAISRMPCSNFAKSSSVPFTVLRTPAKADSNCIAEFTAAPPIAVKGSVSLVVNVFPVVVAVCPKAVSLLDASFALLLNT